MNDDTLRELQTALIRDRESGVEKAVFQVSTVLELVNSALGCQCAACRAGPKHDSDCAVHNMPAYPNGPCNCGAVTK